MARGFTLVEMLVVMVLTSIASVILFQGLSFAFRVQERSGSELFDSQQGAMRRDWYRQTLQALMPDHADGEHRFRGERRRLGGLTLAPLRGGHGVLTPFSWEIRYDAKVGVTNLGYGDGNRDGISDEPVLTWAEDRKDIHFEYHDADGIVHSEWPPFLGKTVPQVPALIVLRLDGVGGPEVILAAPKGPREPPLRRKDGELL